MPYARHPRIVTHMLFWNLLDIARRMPGCIWWWCRPRHMPASHLRRN